MDQSTNHPVVVETMTWDKDTNRMRRFASNADTPRISNLYISKHAPGIKTALRIEVSIRILE